MKRILFTYLLIVSFFSNSFINAMNDDLRVFVSGGGVAKLKKKIDAMSKDATDKKIVLISSNVKLAGSNKNNSQSKVRPTPPPKPSHITANYRQEITSGEVTKNNQPIPDEVISQYKREIIDLKNKCKNMQQELANSDQLKQKYYSLVRAIAEGIKARNAPLYIPSNGRVIESDFISFKEEGIVVKEVEINGSKYIELSENLKIVRKPIPNVKTIWPSTKGKHT